MRKSNKIICYLASFLFIFPTLTPAAQFVVTRVYDGDTVKANSLSKEITLRPVGIDAPKTSKKKNQPGQPYSRKARDYLNHLVLNKMVKIEEYGQDHYRRTLAVIYVGDTNVNLRMVQVGLAEAYKGRPAKGFNPNIGMLNRKLVVLALICRVRGINI